MKQQQIDDLWSAAKFAREQLSKIPAFGDSIGEVTSKYHLGIALNRLEVALDNIETRVPATWEEIKGKAHLYKTAKLGHRYVKLVGVSAPGEFEIEISHRTIHPELPAVIQTCRIPCEQLTDFCL